MEERREKTYFEIPLSNIIKYRPYRKLLFLVYYLYSHEDMTSEEIQQILNSEEAFDDFVRLWWETNKIRMEIDTLITFENWKRCVANNPKVTEFLYNHRRDNNITGL